MKYKLCYFKDNKWIELNLQELDYFKKYNKNKLSCIDGFTMNFYNDYNLKEFLYSNKLISNKSSTLSIITNRKGYNRPIYMGEKLMYQNDLYLYDISNLMNEISSHIIYKEYMRKFIMNYRNKYLGTKNNIGLLLNDIFNNIQSNKNKNVTIFDSKNSEHNDLLKDVYDFINYELYKYDAEVVNDKVKVKSNNKDGIIELGYYKNYRDMVNLIKSLNPNLLKNISDYNDRTLYDEDNLCEEDYKRLK